MTFVDSIELTVISGNGGNGRISFRREKYVPKGGPDGGDGGDGGHVILKTSHKISTFLDISHKRVFKAGHGEDGRPKKQSGKRGDDILILVPVGTTIYDANTHDILHDLTIDDETIILAKGGKGGLGNPNFTSSRVQTPRKATSGKPGQTFKIRLELKIMADVGLIGYPNAGKSTLLKTITQANPKIANYPFTTLYPNLGIFRRFDQEVIIADIPGILEGASKGIGLGNQFLRHISRTRVLLFLVEPIIESIETTYQSLQTLMNEIREYDSTILEEKKIIVAINKMDRLNNDQRLELTQLFSDTIYISCYLRDGIDALEHRIIEVMNENNNY